MIKNQKQNKIQKKKINIKTKMNNLLYKRDMLIYSN